MDIRRATAADKGAIVAFCKEVDPEDYVPDHLDRLMDTGTFLLLYDRARLIGIDRISRLYDGSLWLSAARVHPDYRGRGFIGQLNEAGMRLPAYADAAVARMLITADNTSSLRSAAKNGFHVAAEVSLIEWEAKTAADRRKGAPSRFVPATSLDVYLHIRMSPIFAAQRGLLYITPDFGVATEEYLALAEREGWLFTNKLAGPLFARERRGRDGLGIIAQPFASTTEGAVQVLDFIRERRADWAMLALPDWEPATEPYIRAGFHYSDWGRHSRVFERAVKPSSPAAR